MNDMKLFFKSAGAVFAGFLTVVVLSIATDAVLERVGFFPSPSEGLFAAHLLAIALAYRSVYTVVGGYVTARLSPAGSMRNVKILAGIGLVAGTAGVIAGWNLSAHWYPIALAATAVPLTWFGGTLRTGGVTRTASV